MKIKKFTAKTYRIALDMIKAEFGEDAVILSTNEKKGRQSYVEITAAIDYDNGLSVKADASKLESPFSGRNFAVSRGGFLYGNNDEEMKTHTLKQDCPRRDVDRIKDNVLTGTNLLPDRKKEPFNILKKNSIKGDNHINQHINCENPNNRGLSFKNQLEIKDKAKNTKIIMLIGSTGVGKTTTVAKLSANALKEGKKVGIISLDNYRIGALEQIRIYARIMGVPLYTASSPNALREGIPRFMKNRDLIFIDTMGRNHRDVGYIKFLADSCLIDIPMELHLLLSANSEYEFMLETFRFYNELPISYLALTKIDEAVSLDNLLNFIGICRKPVAYITTGQRVPDDIEFTPTADISSFISNKVINTC